MDLQNKRMLAKSIYCYAQLPNRKIAELSGITEKTLKAWITKYRWQEEKNATGILRQQLLKETYYQLDAINLQIRVQHQGVPTKQLSDAKGVLIKEIETLDEQPLHRVLEVFREAVAWCGKYKPERLADLTELLNGYVEALAKREGLQ